MSQSKNIRRFSPPMVIDTRILIFRLMNLYWNNHSRYYRDTPSILRLPLFVPVTYNVTNITYCNNVWLIDVRVAVAVVINASKTTGSGNRHSLHNVHSLRETKPAIVTAFRYKPPIPRRTRKYRFESRNPLMPCSVRCWRSRYASSCVGWWTRLAVACMVRDIVNTP